MEFDKNNFFNSFPNFYETSETAATPNRLNYRYLALIDKNKDLIKNSTILDLASHDGRWSFAALKNGASKVIGIEGREEHVKNSYKNMEKYGIDKTKYQFIYGELFEEIKKIESNTIDVVLCFGIFYHIMNHALLLSEIKKLNPKYMILDTTGPITDRPIIRLFQEDPKNPSLAIKTSNRNPTVLTGRPSIDAVKLMLKAEGFDFFYHDWHSMGITNWEDLEDYRIHMRTSVLVKNNDK